MWLELARVLRHMFSSHCSSRHTVVVSTVPSLPHLAVPELSWWLFEASAAISEDSEKMNFG